MKRKYSLMIAVSLIFCVSFGTAQAVTTASLVQVPGGPVAVGDPIGLDVIFNSNDFNGVFSGNFTFLPLTKHWLVL